MRRAEKKSIICGVSRFEVTDKEELKSRWLLKQRKE